MRAQLLGKHLPSMQPPSEKQTCGCFSLICNQCTSTSHLHVLSRMDKIILPHACSRLARSWT